MADRQRQNQFANGPNRASSNAAISIRIFDRLAGTTALNQDKDLLGVAPGPTPMYGYSSAPRTFPSGPSFEHSLYPGSYTNSNGNDQLQLDDNDIDLSISNGLDLQWNIDATAPGSSGNAPTVPLPRLSSGGQQKEPWSSEAAATGRKDSTQSTHTPVRPQDLDPNRLQIPNSRFDSGIYSWSSPSGQDAQSTRSAIMDHIEHRANNYTTRLGVDSAYQASVPGSFASSQADMSDIRQGRQMLPTSQTPPRQSLVCTHTACNFVAKTQSEFNKHDAKHERKHICDILPCTRDGKGFPTVNDLNRHKKTVHHIAIGQHYRCFAHGCSKADKVWPRLDNFKVHLKKLHREEDVEELVQRSVEWFENKGAQETATPSMRQPQSETHMFSAVAGSPGTIGAVNNINYSNQMLTRETASSHSFSMNDHSSNYDFTGAYPSGPRHARSGNPRTLSSSMQASAGSGSIPGSKSSRDMARLSQQALRQQGTGPSFSQPRHVPQFYNRNQLQVPPVSMDPGSQYLYTNVPTVSASAVASSLRPGRRGPSKANTAPHLDETSIQRRLGEFDTPSHVEDSTFDDFRGTDYQDFSNIGSAPHLNVETLVSSSPDFSNLSSQAHGPPSEKDTGCQGLQQDLENSIRDFLSEFEKGTVELTPEALRELLRSSFRPLTTTTRNSMPTILMNRLTESSGLMKSPGPDGKSLFRCPHADCPKTMNRQSELNKHCKRHDRPYACTFDLCYKKFGSKNDWKRHEHTQHDQQECWRCHEAISGQRPCSKLYPRRDLYQYHLRQVHRVVDKDMKDFLRKQRLGPKYQGQYWCGFCQKIVVMKQKGVKGDNERFDHICDHFMKEKKDISDWLLPEGGLTKGEIKDQKDQKRESEDLTTGDDDDADGEADECQERDEGDKDDEDDEGSESRSEIQTTSAQRPSFSQQGWQRQQGRPPEQPQQLQQTLAPTISRRRSHATAFGGNSESPFASDAGTEQPSQKKKPAEQAQCCQCRQEKWQSLVISHQCLDCDHKFCQVDCEYATNEGMLRQQRKSGSS